MNETDIENLKSKAIYEVLKNNTLNEKFLDALSEKTNYKTTLALMISLVEIMPKTTICISKKGITQANKYIKTYKKEKKALGFTKLVYNISKIIKIEDVKKIIQETNHFINTKIYIKRRDSIKYLIRCINLSLEIDEICKEHEKELKIRQLLLKNNTQIKIIGIEGRKIKLAKKYKRTLRAMDSMLSKKTEILSEYKIELNNLGKNYKVKLNNRDFFIDYEKLKIICSIKKHY